MALTLFAQLGLLAHLYSLLVPTLGPQGAGLAMGAATAAAIFGRTVVGWTLKPSADRRIVAMASISVQIAGAIALVTAGGAHVPLLIAGVLLFGFGIGNATSLPPMIAQVEFVKDDVARVVPLIVAIAQATYAFAPALFGLLRSEVADANGGMALLVAAAAVQIAAIGSFWLGRKRPLARELRSARIPSA